MTTQESKRNGFTTTLTDGDQVVRFQVKPQLINASKDQKCATVIYKQADGMKVKSMTRREARDTYKMFKTLGFTIGSPRLIL